MKKLYCDYCGKVKEEVSFFIGASTDYRDWVMWEGTGKLSCNCERCFELGRKDSENATKSLVKS